MAKTPGLPDRLDLLVRSGCSTAKWAEMILKVTLDWNARFQGYLR